MKDKRADLLATAQEHHRNNKLSAAKRTYRLLLKQTPSHPIALNNLAAILIDEGEHKTAESLLRRAVILYPSYSDALANLAVCCGMQTRWEECLKWSEKATGIQGDRATTLLWRARAYVSLGKTDHAIRYLTKAISTCNDFDIRPVAGLYLELQSDLGLRKAAIRQLLQVYKTTSKYNQWAILEALHALAIQLNRQALFYRGIDAALESTDSEPSLLYWRAKHHISQDDEDTAIQELMQTARLEPSHAESWLELGLILRKRGNLVKSIACIRRSIRENGKSPRSWQELTSTLIQDKQYREAIRQSGLARKRFPNDPSVLLSHCLALLDGNKPGFALSILEESSNKHLHANDANLMNCKGLALIQKGDYAKAIDTLKTATKLDRKNPGIWNNRGMAYGMADRSKPEIHCYRRAVACNPEDPGSHVNLAMAHLAQQNYAIGLREYEWRVRSNGGSLNALVSGRIVQPGDKPQDLLIITEQGLGDTFQFSRYIYDLRLRLPSSRLTLVCPGKLTGLLEGSMKIVDQVVSAETADLTTKEHIYIPLMSLPHFCGIHPHHSAAPKNYLTIEDELSLSARKLLRRGTSKGAMIIGINWKGNPDAERSNLKGRSMTLEDMKLLASKLPNAVFVALQKGHGIEELKNCSFRHRFIPEQDTISQELCFKHAAAFCLACDYVVTTDTGLAHLSGSLGQITKVLLSKRPEWRWRGSGNKTPWYRNTELYFQTKAGNWQEPLYAVAQTILAQNKGL